MFKNVNFKGSVSSNIHCTCHLLVGLRCRPFHGPYKWRQQRQTKRRYVQGMLDETDPLTLKHVAYVICHEVILHLKVSFFPEWCLFEPERITRLWVHDLHFLQANQPSNQIVPYLPWTSNLHKTMMSSFSTFDLLSSLLCASSSSVCLRFRSIPEVEVTSISSKKKNNFLG